jgi:8-oxo-dGTP diphosphatase
MADFAAMVGNAALPPEVDGLRAWTVGGALVESAAGLLLVRNRRRNGSLDWSPPGGVMDAGETLLGGLTREVEEETGLVVTAWQGPVYEIEAEAAGLGWRLRVETWLATSYDGVLRIGDDPDGIVVDARWVALAACADHLGGAHPWVREPLGEWLSERWAGPRRFGYRIDGTDQRSLSITRL